MKCYACHQDIVSLTKHCPHCGALLEPTQKLLQAVNAHDQEAIIQLYKMEAHRIYAKIRAKGIGDEESKTLVNKAFKDLLTQLPSLSSIDGFEALLDGVSDNTAYRYLVEHDQEVQEISVDDVLLLINDEVIQQLLTDLNQKEEVQKQPKEKKPKAKLITAIVVIALLVASGTAFGMNRYHTNSQKKKEKNVLKAYMEIVDDYQNAYNMSKITENALKRQYPKVSNAAEVAHYHRSDEQANPIQQSLNAFMKDLDHDGTKELLLGYNQDGETYLTGIYRYDAKKKTVIPYPLFKKVEDYKETLITNKNHLIVIDQNQLGTEYALKDHKLEFIQAGISDMDTYLKEKKETITVLPNKPLSAITAQYNKLTGSHKQTVLTQTYNVNKTASDYDLDGDGQKDEVTLKYSIKADPYQESYENYYGLTINGHFFKVNCDNYMDGYLSIIRAQNGSMFLLTHTLGMDEYCTWTLSAYKDHKLNVLAKMQKPDYEKTGDMYNYSGFYVKDNQLTVVDQAVTQFASDYDMETTYNLSPGKAQLVSKEHRIRSCGVNSLDPYYLVLKTKVAMSTYKTKECNEKGIRIPAGVKVKIESIFFMDDYDAYKIKYKGQIGYVKPNNSKKFFKYFSNLEYYDW